jgi:DNA-binding FadR family transcriptional regulator
MDSIVDLQPIDVHSTHEDVQRRIKSYILANKLQPGTLLPTEVQLAKQLGVSRTVIREGLRSLESLGLVYSRRGQGRFVKAFNLDPILQNLEYSMLFDLEDIIEILEIRQRLEAAFIQDAILSMSKETVAELRRLIEEMRRKTSSSEAPTQEDFAFHRAIFQPIGNRVLMKLLDIFWDVFKNLRDTSVIAPSDPQRFLLEHKRVLQAIEAKDAELARQRIVEHFSDLRTRIEAARSINSQVTRPSGRPEADRAEIQR